MKPIITIFAGLLLQLCSIAADTSLVFRQISYSQLFELAKAEKKPVMLYFHFDGCGACLKMEKEVFADQKVIDFYNSAFICFEINTRKGEGIETNKIYNVQLHPTFLYLSENGDTLNKVVGFFGPEKFIRQGQIALDPENSLAAVKQQYKDGRRDSGFLLKYCYRLSDNNELDSALINEYLDTQSLEDLSKEENIRFVYEFCIHNFTITTPYNSRVFNFMYNNQDEFHRYFEKEQVDTRIVWIIHRAIYRALEEQDKPLFDQAIEQIREFDKGEDFKFKEMDGRWTGLLQGKNLVLTYKAAYNSKAGVPDKDNEALQELVKKYWNDHSELNQMAWNYYEEYDDIVKLQEALKWAEQSIKLNSNYYNNDTYAALLYKTGDYKNALKYANKAIKLARKKDIDYGETSKLIKKIKAAEEK